MFRYITGDGTIKQVTSGTPTRRLLIIGTAVDGPLNQPIRVVDGNQITSLFGPARYTGSYYDPTTDTATQKPNGASLPQAIQIAQLEGCRDIYVVRATGTYATNTTAFSSKLSLTSNYPGYIYNQAMLISAVTGSSTVMTLVQPTNKGGNVVFNFTVEHTIEDVIDTLNNAEKNNSIRVNKNAFPTYLTAGSWTLGSGTASLTGGTNETRGTNEAYATSVVDYATKLVAEDTGTFDVIVGEQIPFDVCTLADLYLDDEVVADDPSKSILRDYALFLEEASYKARPCIGTLGLRPTGLVTPGEMIDYANNSLLATSSGFYNETLGWIKAGPLMYAGLFTTLGNTNERIDLGRRVLVTATEGIFNHADIGNYVNSTHISLAAKQTTAEPEFGLQNMSLKSVVGYPNLMPGKYAELLANGVGFDDTNELSGRGAYVVIGRDNYSPTGARVIKEEATAAMRDNFFRNGQLTRLVNAVHTDVTVALRPFINSPTSPGILAAIDRTIQNVMDGYVARQAFRGGINEGYSFRTWMSSVDEKLGTLRVDLELSPATTLQTIVQSITLKEPGA